MRLNGIDHITGITSDGQRCLDFYAGILGLGFLGRDPDFESPDSHLIRLGHQQGRPVRLLPSSRRRDGPRPRGQRDGPHAPLERSLARRPRLLGEAALGGRHRDPVTSREIGSAVLVSRIRRASSTSSASRWRRRTPASRSLPAPSRTSTRSCGSPGCRAYGRASVPSADILAGRLGFEVTGRDSYSVERGQESSGFAFDPPPARAGPVGAGTIHHVAWATRRRPTGLAPAGDRNGLSGDARDRSRRAAARSTSASPRACSSRSPRRPTARGETSADVAATSAAGSRRGSIPGSTPAPSPSTRWSL